MAPVLSKSAVGDGYDGQWQSTIIGLLSYGAGRGNLAGDAGLKKAVSLTVENALRHVVARMGPNLEGDGGKQVTEVEVITDIGLAMSTVELLSSPCRVCKLKFDGPWILALSATLTATIVMATSSQTTSIYGISFEAKYSFTPAFKFFMIANAIVSVYGFLVLFLPSESLLWRLVVALDVIITMLVTSSIAAALAIAYVGKKGNDHAGWLPICNQVPKFCDRVTGALAAVGGIDVLALGEGKKVMSCNELHHYCLRLYW
ncbi:hypothetical protein NE237_000781 [Protea cynaroides]|uniref:CASP-like protein n=1 Tax=Protea cynaroides TaxID=273540 RepID=A0A9Q0QXU0_9MAGN|nr:hypothetical protein NE237_000781 [Protea cynaroides]